MFNTGKVEDNIEVINMEFEVGETVITRISVMDYLTSELVDPDTITITITLNEEVVVDDDDMEYESKGKYYYDYTSDAEGWYDVVITAERVGRTSKESTGFLVR